MPAASCFASTFFDDRPPSAFYSSLIVSPIPCRGFMIGSNLLLKILAHPSSTLSRFTDLIIINSQVRLDDEIGAGRTMTLQAIP